MWVVSGDVIGGAAAPSGEGSVPGYVPRRRLSKAAEFCGALLLSCRSFSSHCISQPLEPVLRGLVGRPGTVCVIRTMVCKFGFQTKNTLFESLKGEAVTPSDGTASVVLLRGAYRFHVYICTLVNHVVSALCRENTRLFPLPNLNMGTNKFT